MSNINNPGGCYERFKPPVDTDWVVDWQYGEVRNAITFIPTQWV